MGRAAILIDKTELEKEISQAESTKTFRNHTELFKHICETPWGTSRKDTLGRVRVLSPATIYQRVKEFGITVQTKQGERGAHLAGAVKTGTRKFKGDKAELLKDVPAEYKTLAERVARGSLKAAVKLKCLDCCCYQMAEVRQCTCTSCPLWGFLKRKVVK